MDINLTKTHCMTISMQKVSSVHKFILKMQRVLGFHELKSHAHAHPKNIDVFFSFPKFLLACKKSVYSICLFLLIQSILESHDQAGHTNYWPPKKILMNFNFSEFLSKCKKSCYFIECSGDIVYLKILQSDWLRAFWPIYF